MTVYVPAVATLIVAVVSPVFHNNVPVKPDAVNIEPPQLLITATAGAGMVELTGVATPNPGGLVQVFIV